jgi:hypothetical protein
MGRVQVKQSKCPLGATTAARGAAVKRAPRPGQASLRGRRMLQLPVPQRAAFMLWLGLPWRLHPLRRPASRGERLEHSITVLPESKHGALRNPAQILSFLVGHPEDRLWLNCKVVWKCCCRERVSRNWPNMRPSSGCRAATSRGLELLPAAEPRRAAWRPASRSRGIGGNTMSTAAQETAFYDAVLAAEGVRQTSKSVWVQTWVQIS